jgi:periplasmic protein TonB
MSTNVESQRGYLRYNGYSRGLTKNQSRAVISAILGVHLVAGWGLLQIQSVREAVSDAAPMFFEVVAEPEPVPPAPPQPRPVPKMVLPAPLISTPTQSESSFVAESPEPEVPTESVEATMVQAPPAPPAPPPPPKIIPASAIQYLVPPQMEYPRASRPFHEAGRVIVHVYVDEAGLPKITQVSKSSGFARLDEAGIKAVQKARFKPYVENGHPTAGWAFIPLNFELEY